MKDCKSDVRGCISEDLCAACEGRVILVMVAVVVVAVLTALVFASFCRGSFKRLACAAALRFEMEICLLVRTDSVGDARQTCLSFEGSMLVMVLVVD